MDIPEINMISDFEAGMKCLQNPSLFSRFFSFPGIEKTLHVYRFWKWGALILAIFATFSSIINTINKLIFIHFHTIESSKHKTNDEIIEFDDDVSLASSDDDDYDDDQDIEEEEEEEEEENSPTTSFFGQQHRVDEDFRVNGSSLCFKSQGQNGQLRRRSFGGSWSDFTTSGKSVVKLWESLSLSLDFDEDLINGDSRSVVSMWDSGELGNGSAAAMSSPAVVFTAEGNGNGDGICLGGYDSRMRRGVPAIYAEWESPAGEVAIGGVRKVYVRDDVSGVVTVGDVRNVRKPLESVRESDGETWWDADAVIVEKEGT